MPLAMRVVVVARWLPPKRVKEVVVFTSRDGHRVDNAFITRSEGEKRSDEASERSNRLPRGRAAFQFFTHD